MIDLLVPVLGRPHNVEPLLASLAGSTDVPHRVLFLCSVGDADEIRAVEQAGAEYLLFDGPPANGQYAKKINLGYRASEAPWLFLGADDVVFHRGWAETALAAAGDRYHVISLNDKANYFVRQGLLATHSLIRRSYADDPGCSLDGPGVIYHEGYCHNFVDCELSVLARDRNVFFFARDAIVEHMHPAFGRAPSDRIYDLGFKDFMTDRVLFVERMNDFERDRLVQRFFAAVRGDRLAAVRAARRRGRSR